MSARKTIFLVVIGAFGVGAMIALEPSTSLNNRDDAAVLAPLYAPPVEQVETMSLERGQTLSVLLTRASIVGSDLANLLRALNDLQNLRSIAAGSEITVRRWLGRPEARSVELRVNRDTTIKVARSDAGWTTSLVVTPVVLDTIFANGEIAVDKSLYESIAFDRDLTLPNEDRIPLVVALARIYEYRLDFAHEIQPGDGYTVVYEREARPDGTARSMRILTARIESRGKRYDAIHFRTAGLTGYYDLEGKPLRSGFKLYPVDYVRITSSFAWRRYHPILGIYRAHLGTDFGAPKGTPVRATGDGTVQSLGRGGGYGNVVTIRHMNGYSTRYAHLSRFAAGLRSGKRVQTNEIVGYVGATGLATAPHLHYELRFNGRPINFRDAKLPTAPPLPVAYRDEYFGLVKDRTLLLEEALNGARLARKAAIPNPAVGGGI